MNLTPVQLTLSILLAVAGVMLTRFLPFLVFRPDRPTPPFVAYLGKWLGPAVFGLLVVYCLRTPLTTGAHLVPTLVCTAVTMALQLWKRQMMLSMAVGTGLYMVLLALGGWGARFFQGPRTEPLAETHCRTL